MCLQIGSRKHVYNKYEFYNRSWISKYYTISTLIQLFIFIIGLSIFFKLVWQIQFTIPQVYIIHNLINLCV